MSTHEYQAYLSSRDWWQQRKHALRRAGYRCERCSSREALEVHHKNYWNLGDEEPEDLEVLCSTCHRNQHLACNRMPRVREAFGQGRLFDRWVDPDLLMNPKKEVA